MSTTRKDETIIRAGIGGPPPRTVHAPAEKVVSGVVPVSNPGTVHGGTRITSGFPQPQAQGQGVPPAQLDLNGKVYQFERVISTGTGEAQIYLVSLNNRQVVLKLYFPNFNPKMEILQRLVQLNHQDIVNVLDFGFTRDDRFFEIMEFAAGGPLDKYLPIKDVRRLKTIVSEVINAFKYCHANGIIHRDIKPENIYLKNENGTDILIGDFGISSQLDSEVSRRLTSQSCTLGYAAPEMYGIDGTVFVGNEVDYYALGITLIHLWDGQSPFQGLPNAAIVNATISGNIRIPPDLPTELETIVKGLITIDYKKRWGYEEVQRWLRGEKVRVHFHTINPHPPYQFSQGLSAVTPLELAGILKHDMALGIRHLYGKRISQWLSSFEQGMAVELDQIVETDYPRNQDAGIQKALFILDPEAPYIHTGSEGTISCRTTAEIADVLESNAGAYQEALAKTDNLFYLFLEARGGTKKANLFRKSFTLFSKRKALHTIIIEMRGPKSLTYRGLTLEDPTQFLACKDQQQLAKDLKDPESIVSVWIELTHPGPLATRLEQWRRLGEFPVPVNYVFDASKNAGQAAEEGSCIALVNAMANKALKGDNAGIAFINALFQEKKLDQLSTLINRPIFSSLDLAWRAEVTKNSNLRAQLEKDGIRVPGRHQYLLLAETLLCLLPGSRRLDELRANAASAGRDGAQDCPWFAALGSATSASPGCALVMEEAAPMAKVQAEVERKVREWPRLRRWLLFSSSIYGITFGVAMAIFRSQVSAGTTFDSNTNHGSGGSGWVVVLYVLIICISAFVSVCISEGVARSLNQRLNS
jgi:serine/threonine protein kinase